MGEKNRVPRWKDCNWFMGSLIQSSALYVSVNKLQVGLLYWWACMGVVRDKDGKLGLSVASSCVLFVLLQVYCIMTRRG